MGIWLGAPSRSSALPIFAHRYGVSCQTCHSIVPRLNAFGQAFKDAGFRWPGGVTGDRTFPIAVRVNLAYSSLPDPTGLPKAIVDEVEFLSAGPIDRHLLYYAEQYSLDGGRPGKTRDAYLEYQTRPLDAWSSNVKALDVDLVAGQFTLPLPADPETMRPTENHYAVFDQTVGANPFNFFDPRIGVNLGIGNADGWVRALLIKGHDPQSGLQTDRPDTMLVGEIGGSRLSLFGYTYEGARPLGGPPDLFQRRGLALKSIEGRSRFTALVQTGFDSNADGLGTAAFSSGGFVQEEYALTPLWIGVVRFDRAYDAIAGPMTAMTYSLSARPYLRARFTVEYVVAQEGSVTRALNLGWLFAY